MYKIFQSSAYGPSLNITLEGLNDQGMSVSGIGYTVQQNFIPSVGSLTTVPNINVTNNNTSTSVAFLYNSTGDNSTTFGPTRYNNISVLKNKFNIIGRNCDTNYDVDLNKPGQVWLGIPNYY